MCVFLFLLLIEDTTSVPALKYMYFSSWGQAAQQDNKMDGMT